MPRTERMCKVTVTITPIMVDLRAGIVAKTIQHPNQTTRICRFAEPSTQKSTRHTVSGKGYNGFEAQRSFYFRIYFSFFAITLTKGQPIS